MENSVKQVEATRAQQGTEAVPASQVLRTLSGMMQSTPFRASKQAQRLLQYIVDESLAGRPEALKERMIGIAVFNRRPDYDTNSDPIVRLRVAEVRKRLALYYQNAGDESVLISIPSGSFRAVFDWVRPSPAAPLTPSSWKQEPNQQAVEPITQPVLHELEGSNPAFPAKFRDVRWWLAIAASAIILTSFALHYFAFSDERALNQFWSPVLSSDMALIYIGNNPVYELSPYFVEEYFRKHPQSRDAETGANTYIPAPPEITDAAKDLVPAKDTYVSNGDVAATSKIVALLAQRGKQFDIRYGSDVTYGDFRLHPTVLIGAHNNYWTLSTTKNLRIAFEGLDSIVDRSDAKKSWVANSDRTEDYALVSRVMNAWNGKVVVVVAGVGQGGTRAAAEFVTNPQSISKLTRSLPRGWQTKNIQIVLHTRVKNQIPSAPEVVSTYCW